MKQQHTVGIYESIKCFQPTMWESRCLPWREVQVALSWREIGVGWLIWVFIRHSFFNKDNILEEPSHSRDACLGITYRLGPTWRWSIDTIIYTDGNTRVLSSSLYTNVRIKPLQIDNWHFGYRDSHKWTGEWWYMCTPREWLWMMSM